MKNNMYEKLLHIGLTKTEAKIYLMLVDITKAQAGVLSRKTGIHRRSIYDALDRLIEKGLVSYIVENDKRFYMASNPKRIQEMIDTQRNEIHSIMPTLLAKFAEHKGKQETLFFRGKEGIKEVFEDQIRVGKDVYIIGATPTAREQLKYYLPHYTNKRIENKIKLHAIYAGEKHKSPVPLSSVRYLPKSFQTLVSTNIYGDTAAIILWLPHDPVAILIKQPDIAKTFKNYFDMLWKIAK
jgi:sugar-specific transcriptional regulator TrmB